MINIRDLHHNYKDYDGKVVTIGSYCGERASFL